MKFGLVVPSSGPNASRDILLTMAKLAQRLKFDSLWISDHVFIPYRYEPLYPYTPSGRFVAESTDNALEPLISLAYMAVLVDVPILGISVLVMPYRNPILTAKMLVTLDVLSQGKVILGAGVGWLREEFETLGASYEDRAGVTDEYIEIFKRLCTEERLSFQGKHYQFSNVSFYPRPVQRPHPSVWIGGYSMPAMRRAARLGDGWHPSNIHPDTLAEKLPVFRRLCEQAGRDPENIQLSTRINNMGFGSPGGDGDARPAPLSGSPQDMIDTIHRYEETGVSHIALGIRGPDLQGLVQNVERFASEVMRKI